MSYKKCFSFLLLVGAALLFGAREAKACECNLEPITVLDAYDAAELVVITRAASVEKADAARHLRHDVSSTRMVVEQVFKGGLKVGDEMIFGQGGGADCIWTFSEGSIGQRYLFYLDPRAAGQTIWFAVGCGRSTSIEDATEDLLYLNRLDELRGKTRISGKVEFVGGREMSVGGRVIRITGAKQVHEVKTNEKGVYEIYDLPPGAYTIAADTPAGWKVGGYYPRSYTTNFDGRTEAQSPKRFYIFLGDKKHVPFDVRFERDDAGAARGKN
jgi:hypothetical protein